MKKVLSNLTTTTSVIISPDEESDSLKEDLFLILDTLQSMLIQEVTEEDIDNYLQTQDLTHLQKLSILEFAFINEFGEAADRPEFSSYENFFNYFKKL